MRIKNIISILFVIVYSLSSCEKPPTLSLQSPMLIELGADGGNETITFVASKDWTISCSESWVHINPTSGEASALAITVVVNFDANTVYEDRVATVYIHMEDLSQRVSVRQGARIAVSSILLEPASLELVEGTAKIIVATVLPENATDKTIIWSSSNEDIAMVDDGKVVAIKSGTAIISAKSGETKAECEIVVVNEHIALNKTVLMLKPGDSEVLEAIPVTKEGSTAILQWGSDNTDVVQVDGYGMVIAISAGTARITVSAGTLQEKCIVSVLEYAEPDAVDLGLSVQWASFNLGAITPEAFGEYCMWKDDLNEDIVQTKLGNGWRMPTYEEAWELISTCSSTWTVKNGVAGRVFVRWRNGSVSSVFLPATGGVQSSQYKEGYSGTYWTSTSIPSDDPDWQAYYVVCFSSDGLGAGSGDRRLIGFPIRPVRDYHNTE